MIEFLIGAAVVSVPFAVLAHQRAADQRAWALREERLLDRIQAPEVAVAHASATWDDPLEPEQPVGWIHDETGLISEPVYASDRPAPTD